MAKGPCELLVDYSESSGLLGLYYIKKILGRAGTDYKMADNTLSGLQRLVRSARRLGTRAFIVYPSLN